MVLSADSNNSERLFSEVVSSEAIGILKDSGFKVFSSWQSLGSELNVPLDTRRQLRYEAIASGDHNQALEECLDYWVKNNPNASWEKLIEAVERTDEKEASRKMRERFHFGKTLQSRQKSFLGS